jgi:hypothetical protein
VALSPAQQTAVSKIAGLTVMNAMVFQEVLAKDNYRVEPLRHTIDTEDRLGSLTGHWKYILDEIDYVPIFRVARDLLLELPASADVERALKSMATHALAIVRRRAALRHDLMGRVYHRLLVEAKYLGTYYTSVPAATLLLKLALDPDDWPTKWADLGEIADLRIGDLACGTGTLLMAAAEAVSDNYVRGCTTTASEPDLKQLHRILMEKVIFGFDVLPSALHLTASTLALRASAVGFNLTHLFSLPLGGDQARLGSIEFLRSQEIHLFQDIFGGLTLLGQVAGSGEPEEPVVQVPDLDLCVMNPPFTRSVGGNLLFGASPEAERAEMQKKLRALLSDKHDPVMASSTAGLGSVFVAVGDRRLSVGGRMALVLPRALLSGVAWEKTRELIGSAYQLEYVIVSHDPDRWNFSDNTNLSEVLVVARKEGSVAALDPEEPTYCVNLRRNPGTVFEALSIAQSIREGEAPDLATGQGALDVKSGGTKVGEALAVAWSDLRTADSWLLPCAFAQADLVRTAYSLAKGSVVLPGQALAASVTIQLMRLDKIATLGPDRRDIYDGFDLTDTPTPYAALWGNDALSSTRLTRSSNKYLSPLPTAKPGRPLRHVEDLWPKAGRVMILEKLRLNTQQLISVYLDKLALSNVWWPVALGDDDERRAKALVLWLNSTLGLIQLLARREETEGPWMGFKKPTLGAMMVLDLDALSEEALSGLAASFDEVATQDLRPFPEMAADETRAQIDRALTNRLGLPDLSGLRGLLAQEPVVSNAPLA